MDSNICTCAIFSTSINFGLPTYFVSHYCYRRALYPVFFLKKRRGELFDSGVANNMSKVTHVGLHGVDTMFLFCYI